MNYVIIILTVSSLKLLVNIKLLIICKEMIQYEHVPYLCHLFICLRSI